MDIQICAVGKLKEAYWRDAVEEYAKRLARFASLEITEVKEELLPANASAKGEEMVKEEEGKRLLEKTGEGRYVILLDIKGKELSSEALAEKMEALAVSGKSKITFIIGGSLGVSEAVRNRADYRLSFSPMTFPHQMMRVILLEQVYRSFKIRNRETYHK